MTSSRLLPLSVFALAAAVALHALRPAQAQATSAPVCEKFSGMPGGITDKAQAWLTEQQAAGRVHGSWGSQLLDNWVMVCAW